MTVPRVGIHDPAHLRQHLTKVADDLLARGVSEQDVERAIERQHAYLTGELGRAVQTANDRDESAIPDYGTQVAGGIAGLARDIPGAEVLQAGARSLVRGQPYKQSLADIRGAEADNPATIATRLAGGGAAAAALPALASSSRLASLGPRAARAAQYLASSPAKQGAALGAADALLDANPEHGMETRIGGAVVGGAVGGAVGKLADLTEAGVRTLMAPSLGKRALARKQATKAADAVLYGASAAEGQGKALGPFTGTLDAPDVAPYIAEVKNSRQFAGADDATVLREAYKLMGDRQGALKSGMASSERFRASPAFESGEIGLAKRDVMDAAEELMPTFPKAVGTHAELSRIDEQAKLAAKVGRAMASGKQTPLKKLTTESPEGFEATIADMTPQEATEATRNFLGGARENIRFRPNALGGFGAFQSAITPFRIAPTLRKLDAQSGVDRAVRDLIEKLAMSAGASAGNP